MSKRWKLKTADAAQIQSLHRELRIKESLCEILVKRGIHTFEEAKKFFRPSYEELHDPFLMKDMQKAVERIETAIAHAGKILILGDYDVDGTTAIAILNGFFKRIYQHDKFHYYVPERYSEGYGVSFKAVDFAKERGYQLIISLDCGIKANEQIQYALEKGIDFIVCDHHLPGEILPAATAILNPKQPGCSYPYKELSGCGVTFKLITALAKQRGLQIDSLYCYLDLLMLSIAADIVPITGENRAMAWLGLKHFNENACTGLKALLNLQKEKGDYTLRDVVFGIAPSINAAGRMGDAVLAVELFTENDPRRAATLAQRLWEMNLERKEADAQITMEAHSLINSTEGMPDRKTTVVFKEGWHKGVVGIVASRLIEIYHRPTIVLSLQETTATGSARSVPGFNISSAIAACAEHLLTFGGHEAAAGLSLNLENLDAFAARFEEVVAETIADDLLIPEIRIDAEIGFEEINLKYLDILKQMEPFGPQNPRPVFLTRGVTNTQWSKIVKEKHLRAVLQHQRITLSGIGFGLAGKFSILTDNALVDVVYCLDENEWNGNKSVQLKILDIRPGAKE